MIVAPDSELEAINEIIGSIGESPINTLIDCMDVDVLNAKRILDNVMRNEQSKDWSFNNIIAHTLTPDINLKRIYWLEDIVYIKDPSGNKIYRRQGDYLFNVTDNTLEFTEAITVNCRFLTTFNEMPMQMRHYVTARAARIFQKRYLGDPQLAAELAQDEAEAWAALQELEVELNNFNIFNNLSIQDTAGR